MPDGIGRRRFLKHTAAGLAAATAAAGAYYYFGHIPQSISPQTTTATTSQALVTTARLNPVIDYAEQKGLESEVIQKLEPLGYDGVLDRNERALIDFLADIDKLVSSQEDRRADKIRDLRIKAVTDILADGVSDTDGGALKYLRGFSPETQKMYIEFGLENGTSEYLLYVSTLPDTAFARWAAERKLCFHKRSLTDLDRAFLREPSTHANQVMQTYIDDARKHLAYTDLAAEIQKIPEVKAGIKSGSIEDLEAVEDLVYGAIQANPEGARLLQEALDEGIPAKRKYCAPLQALLWCAYDYEFNELLDIDELSTLTNYSYDIPVDALVGWAWTSTTASENYRSDKWKKFSDVVDRLSSPRLLCLYMSKKFTYYYPKPYREQTAEETFATKRGDCGNQSRFAQYCLFRNGYEAYWLYIQWRPDDSGHVCCLYRDKDGKWYFHDNTLTTALGIFGPFPTVKEAEGEFLAHCRRLEYFESYRTYVLDINGFNRASLVQI